MNKHNDWFRWIMLLGFLVTNFFALPGILYPAAVADLIGAQPPTTPVWLAFAFLLSFLVSWFYIPAALEPIKNLPTAYLAVFSRFFTGAFWLWFYSFSQPGPAPVLWMIDFGFGAVLLVLLVFTVREPSTPVA